MPEWRSLCPGPHPVTMRHDHQQPASTIEDPPAFIQHPARVRVKFERMHQKQAVGLDVRNRECMWINQHRADRLVMRPDNDALTSRHQHGVGIVLPQKRCGKPNGDVTASRRAFPEISHLGPKSCCHLPTLKRLIESSDFRYVVIHDSYLPSGNYTPQPTPGNRLRSSR